MQRETFYDYANYRFLKVVAALSGIASALYGYFRPHYGGSWLGYATGCLALVIVVVLSWYGVRKRRQSRRPDRRGIERRRLLGPAPSGIWDRRVASRRAAPGARHRRSGGTLLSWLSGHVYFGLLAVVLASLHAGFRLGWNVHSLAYALMILVAASGCFGAIAYVYVPRRISQNLGEETRRGLLLRIAELDELAVARSLALPDRVRLAVAHAATETRIGQGLIGRLRGTSRRCPTDAAVEQLRQLGSELTGGEQPRLIRDLYVLLLQKQGLVQRVRTDVALNARLQLWLHVHTPLTLALLAALSGHVIAVLVFW